MGFGQLPQPCLHLHLQPPEQVSCAILLSLSVVRLRQAVWVVNYSPATGVAS